MPETDWQTKPAEISMMVPILGAILAVLMFREQIVLLWRMAQMRAYIARLERRARKLEAEKAARKI